MLLFYILQKAMMMSDHECLTLITARQHNRLIPFIYVSFEIH